MASVQIRIQGYICRWTNPTKCIINHTESSKNTRMWNTKTTPVAQCTLSFLPLGWVVSVNLHFPISLSQTIFTDHYKYINTSHLNVWLVLNSAEWDYFVHSSENCLLSNQHLPLPGPQRNSRCCHRAPFIGVGKTSRRPFIIAFWQWRITLHSYPTRVERDIRGVSIAHAQGKIQNSIKWNY